MIVKLLVNHVGSVNRTLKGDLGAIDEKYDVAISTTCGPLDFIVVDNVDTAQKCVELLRRERLGIASFLALDKQEKLRPYMARPASTYVVLLFNFW